MALRQSLGLWPVWARGRPFGRLSLLSITQHGHGQTRIANKGTSVSSTDIPDFKTDVNIHEHKLSRPTKTRPRWEALKNLGQMTQVRQ